MFLDGATLHITSHNRCPPRPKRHQTEKKFGEIKTKDRRVQARGLMGRISKISKTINYGNLYGAAAAVRNRVYGQKKRRKKRLETGTRVLEKIAINYSVKCWPFKRFFFSCWYSKLSET